MQLTREQAIQIAESNLYERLSNRERALLQLSQDKLFMPMDKFHEAVEELMGRPVWTHEFAHCKLLLELFGMRETPVSPMESLSEALDRCKS